MISNDYNIPIFWVIFQLISPFFVIGTTAILTGIPFLGFIPFYILNCMFFPYFAVKHIQGYDKVWKKVKNTSWLPSTKWEDIRNGIGLAAILYTLPIVAVMMQDPEISDSDSKVIELGLPTLGLYRKL
mmetsp:Transcript_2473/g.2909  ORF Transcript_2473/g.2909 Transcript_2473/m.2909 type:complete len:128 (+) Transcript_2473:13-396(+)